MALVRAGKPTKQTAVELSIHPVTLSKWLRQDDIDHGLRPGKPSAELRAARRRIRELETELTIIRHAAKFLGEDTSGPKDGSTGDRQTRRGRGTGGPMLSRAGGAPQN
ncbi:transposase [Nocardia cyriacigeorgica]|uniref:transposase n=1 Tax=Nocardia cyriacigeorgica TaxID=135487 RepID=UPI003D77CF1F